MARRVAKWLGLCLGVGLALVAALLVATKLRGAGSPDSLPRSAGLATEQSRDESREQGRLILHVTLRDPALGRFGLVVSLPDPLPSHPLPVLVVLGGLGPGLRTLRQLPPAGDNAVVGYDWPVPRETPEGLEWLWRGPALYEEMFKAPGQIAAAVEWVAGRPWAQRDRISLLGFSLGALAAPAAQRLLEARRLPVGWTVLAYGGADLGHLLRRHPRAGPGWLRPALGWLGDWLFRPLDPVEHLPHLSGRFLVIGGADDALIPARSARLMRELAPEPKHVVLLSGQHIGVGGDQRALRERILAVTEDWLLRWGAVNPR